MRARRLTTIGCLAVLLAAASACSVTEPSGTIPPRATSEAPEPAPTSAAEGWWRADGTAQTLAADLAAPWSVVPLDGGGALVSQRDDGRVIEVTPAGEQRVAGAVPGVVSGGESGLHGLAVREADPGSRWLYAYHGARDDNRVVRMPLTGAAGELELGDAEVVFSGIPRASTHNGGRIAFGPDGMLYVTTGDAQQRDAAQDEGALGGKILRLTPDGEPALGNPWDNAAWSLGHRNVQGIAWTSDGTMWASEFGQNTWDELNRIEAGSNYGWPVVEGAAGRDGLTDPVVTWATSDASPSGIAAVGDTVFIAGLRGERLWAVDTAGGALASDPEPALAGEQGRLRDVVAARGPALWVLTGNTDGRGDPRAGDDVLLRLELTPQP